MRRMIFGLVALVFFSAAAARAQSGRWARPAEVDIYHERAGDFMDIDLRALTARADALLREQQYEEAARHYLYTLQFDPGDARLIYNLACCYARLGKAALAMRYLRRALDGGFNAYDVLVSDPDLAPLRGHPGFDTLMVEARRMSRNSGEIIYFKGEKAMKCRVRLPDNYQAGKKYPLLVGLHGNGGNADDMITLYRDFADRDFIFITPEGPYPYPQNDNASMNRYSWAVQIKDEQVWEMADPLTLDYIAAVVRQARERYKVSQVYLLGFSQGAAYACLTGLKYPRLFNAILCFGGALRVENLRPAGITERDIEKAAGLRVFIAHGLQDQAIGHEAALDAHGWLHARGMRVELVNFSGGHVIPANVLNRGLAWASLP